jgi:hypothetical protein
MRRWYDNNLQTKKEYDRDYRQRRKKEAADSLPGEAVHVEDEG